MSAGRRPITGSRTDNSSRRSLERIRMLSAPPRRKFPWFDAAILVAATGLGIVMTNSCLEIYDAYAGIDQGRLAPHGFRRWGFAAVPLFVSWSLALLALR